MDIREYLMSLSDRQLMKWIEDNYCLDQDGLTAVEIVSYYNDREDQLTYLGF